MIHILYNLPSLAYCIIAREGLLKTLLIANINQPHKSISLLHKYYIPFNIDQCHDSMPINSTT